MSTDSNSPPTRRLSARPLVLARLSWWAIAILTLVYTVAALAFNIIGKPQWNFLETDINLLKQTGIPLDFYSTYWGTIASSTGFVFLIAGCFIFWRRSDDWLAISTSLTIMASGLIATNAGLPLATAQLAWLIPYVILYAIVGAGAEIIFFAFPDGRFIPSWGRWVVVLVAIFTLFKAVVTLIDQNLGQFLLFYILMILFSVSLVPQIYRYRRVSNQAQRQQAKWVICGLGLMIFVTSFDQLLYPLYIPYLSGLSAKFYYFVYLPTVAIVIWLAPVIAIVFSALRYRLWDIDFVINRSVVYGALTALLIALFGLSLWTISLVFQDLAGGQQPVIALVVTALVFGTIFQPARRNLQRFVDRRFYHIEIDYQKTPAASLPISVHTKPAFGPYQNLELIGRGGMGDVYKTEHPTLNRPIALKLLHGQLATEGNIRQRFQREAKIATALRHPNIVQVLESGEVNGTAYMVMEYLDGKDLAAHLLERGRWPLTDALPILQGIAAALDCAHQQGFVHRDIKPSNVILEGMRPVLTDFGIAKVLGGHTVMTQTGAILGTLDYIAPEQIQASANIDGRADVYSFGVMAFQMLTGELPFKHNNPGALLIAHLTQPAPDPREIVPDLSRVAAHAIQRAMAKHPDERFATEREFVAEISRNEN